MRCFLSTIMLALALHALPSDGATLKVGVLNDMSGPYADASGRGSVLAAQMAAEDFATTAGAGAPQVEILSADHQNKADVGSAIARRWVDVDGVAAIVDVPNSAVALALNALMRDKNRAFLPSSAVTSDLTGSQCAPTTVHWTTDTWALANGTARALAAAGDKTWFFISADYALGRSLVQDATGVLVPLGGKVVGDVRHPIGAADLSSFLLQAQSSGAQVIAIADAGADTTTAIKQAAEFGIGQDAKQRLVGLLVFISDVHALGLDVAKGLLVTEAFYWNLNAKTRDWSLRFAARNGGRMPTMNHAGVYAQTLAFLRAAQAAGVPDNGVPSGRAVVARMKQLQIDDDLFGRTTIREDGRATHDMYLFEVKAPAERKEPWDYYKVAARIPAEVAFRPLDQGKCPLVH